MIGERLVLYPCNWYRGHLDLVYLSISLELWHENCKDIHHSWQFKPLTLTIHISHKNQKGFITSHCQHVGNIINLSQKIVEFEFGNDYKLNVQVWPWPFISDPAMKRYPLKVICNMRKVSSLFNKRWWIMSAEIMYLSSGSKFEFDLCPKNSKAPLRSWVTHVWSIRNGVFNAKSTLCTESRYNQNTK